MTYRTFLKKLRQTSKHFGSNWRLHDLETAIFDKSPTGSYCPITAVARMEFELFYPRREVLIAGEKLGLQERTIRKIVKAADYSTPSIARSEILKACGLTRNDQN